MGELWDKCPNWVPPVDDGAPQSDDDGAGVMDAEQTIGDCTNGPCIPN